MQRVVKGLCLNTPPLREKVNLRERAGDEWPQTPPGGSCAGRSKGTLHLTPRRAWP